MGNPGTGTDSWTSAALTDAGARRAHNEDAVLARDDAALWCVADGMGGHEAGEVASAGVVEALEALSGDDALSEAIDRVDDSLMDANRRLRDYAARELGGRTLGATVVVMLVRGRLGACLWAGDSRLFRWRDGELRQLSSDHSEVQQLVDQGVLEPEEADDHPNANVITRAVGAASRLFADVVLFSVEPGDRFLLCSDGLYNELTPDEIARELGTGGPVDVSARSLLDQALERGARDNVSVVVTAPEAP
jgi:serine/threonine protein phosphatase PrpC